MQYIVKWYIAFYFEFPGQSSECYERGSALAGTIGGKALNELH